MTTNAMWTRQLLRAAALVAAASVIGCTTSEQEQPALAGPSEFGQSITVTVDRDRIPQDGVSRANVVATIYNADGKPITGDRRVTVQWQVSATNGAFVEPSVQQSDTDGEGKARMFVTAPPPPAFLPTGNARLVVTARVVGSDFLNNLNLRTVEVQLIPPVGTLPVNNLPVPAFSIAPAIANINQDVRFDASLTMDEGEPCGDLCTYQWDFGDFETASGRVVTKSYNRPATFKITLTVTDSRGGVSSVKHDLIVQGPEPPKAHLTIDPESAVGGTTVAFNAAGSTVGLGATIVQYQWEFGHGQPLTTDVPVATKVYPEELPESQGGKRKNYPVVLRVIDSLGRESVTTGTVTVLPNPEPTP